MADGNQKIPFMLELDTAKWLYDSDKMYPYLEEKYTSKKLGSLESLPDVYAWLCCAPAAGCMSLLSAAHTSIQTTLTPMCSAGART